LRRLCGHCQRRKNISIICGLDETTANLEGNVKRYGFLAMVVAFSAAACASGDTSNGRLDVPTAPSVPGSAVEGQVNVTRVRVFIKDGRPQAFVQGEIGDGCTTFTGVTQRRSGNTIEISATSRRQGEVCTMIMQLMNEWVVLDGSFGPGDYTVRANARTLSFRLVRDAAGDLRVDPDPGPLPQPPYLPLQ
jgi:hypothetical protein